MVSSTGDQSSKGCRLCPLGELALTNCMQPKGTGKILLVLSSPSGEEDLNGETGSGIIGKILKELLRNAGIAESLCTITHAIRCTILRGYNRTNESVISCRTYLQGTLNTRSYGTIISFGDYSLRSLTKKSGIKKHRGKPIPLHKDFGIDQSVFPTYGIEDLMRVPTYKRTIISDLRNAVGENEEAEEVSFTYWKV